MASLSDLTPAERAHLLGKPEGELGIAIGAVMNNTNAKLIETVYQRLGLHSGQSVIEIGFGNGHTVPLLLPGSGEYASLPYLTLRSPPHMLLEARPNAPPLNSPKRAD